jgi:tetratricopeptide (TPR) repeat protein
MKRSDQQPPLAKSVSRSWLAIYSVKNIATNIRQWIDRHKLWTILILAVVLFILAISIWLVIQNHHKVQVTNPVVATYAKQLPDLKKKAETNPNDANARKNYAVALYVTRDLEQAKQQYEAATVINDKDAVTYNNLGNVYRDLGKINEAIDAYKKSLELDPDSVNTYANLANIQMYSKNKPLDAIETYKTGLSHLPGNTQLQLLLGLAYEQAKDIPSAKQTYENILANDKDNTAAKANLERLNK